MRPHAQRWRTWGFGALIAAVAAMGLLSFSRRIADEEPSFGVEWVGARAGVTAIALAPGGPAERAGLLPGDVLLRADGRRVDSALVARHLPWDSRGSATEIEVRRGETVVPLTLRPAYVSSVPPIYAFLSVVGLAFLVSGAFVVFRLPTVRGATLYGFLAVGLFTQLVWSHTSRAEAADWAIYWGDVAAGALVPALLIHLTAVLSRGASIGRGVLVGLAYAGSAAIVASGAWLSGAGGARGFADPAAAITAIDRATLLFLSLAALVGLGLLGRSYATFHSGLHRSQIRWMLWGLALGIGPFVAAYAVPWALGVAIPTWADVSVFPMLFVPASFTVAMARYRLHDLDVVLRRGFAAVTLAFVTVGVYAAALVLVRRLVADLELPDSVLGFAAALITAVAYPSLRSAVRGAVDRAFYRARYSYRATLLEWGRELNAETDLPSLLDRLERRVIETLDVPIAKVLVRSGEGRFEEMGGNPNPVWAEVDRHLLEGLDRHSHVVIDEGTLPALPKARYLFGMKVKGKITAVLAAAEREGAEPLSSEDRGLLSTFASHTATAIEAARLVREVRRHAEEVGKLEARQETILENSGAGLLLANAEGRVLAWNRTLEAIYGVPRDEAIGRTLSEVFPLHTVRRIERAVAEAETTQEVRIYRHTLVNRRGERIIVNVAVSPADAVDRGDGTRVMTFDDATAQVKLEEQVLRQERLASLGLLAAGVAHEVNTPLTGISSYTQMLLESLDDADPRRDVLLKIEAQSRRVSEIANSLLNLARPERSTFERLSLNEVVREILALFEPQIRGRGIRLDVRLDDSLPAVLGHRGKLQQVLLNLLLNARDAVGEGGNVTVTTAADRDQVLLEVHDDGVGIAEDDLPRIFDPFFTTKGRGKGTGLGLSISYGIVREHDGDMAVESIPGEMTRFRVRLPSCEAARALA